MNNENLKPIEKLTPFTKMIMTIGTLPSSFYASMSYYESMVWLYEYLKNQVIPTVNNNAEAVEELQTAFITLKTWIENYFENLDVQEEINKKLDEMAEDGTLTDLIKDYVDPIYEDYESRINEQVNYQNETIANFEIDVNQTLSNYNNKINSLFNYSPIPVSSTSDMTDTSKVYVNTTNGKWYYYDGDSWEIGGTYQASSNDEFLDINSTNSLENKTITNAFNEVINITTNDEATITDTITPTWTAGYYGANGDEHESTTIYHTEKISVTEGDVISYIDFDNYAANMRFITAYNANDEAVTASGSDTALTTYTVPSGIVNIIISNNRTSHPIILILKSHSGTTQNVNNKNEINKEVTKTSQISYSTTSGLLSYDGNVTPSASFEYTNSISVTTGDIILINSKTNPTSGARAICAYIGESVCKYKGQPSSLNDITKYIVPEYITSIRITIPVSITDFSIIKISKYNQKLIKNNTIGGYYYNGEIEQNEIIKFDYTNLKPSYNINFSANISNLDTIEFGYIDDNNTFFRLLAVNNSEVIGYNSGNQYKTENHGLTIANDIGISFKVLPYINGYDRATVSIFSNGNKFTIADNYYTYGYSIKGKLALKINNSVVSNCAFSVGIENIDKPIWIFGDSWISNSTDRWVRYLVINDFNKNCFMNGFPGETSAEGLIALQNLFKLKKPKYLLWLYGMNDTDSSNAISSDWLTALNSVIDLCIENHIELILATIPTTPTKINYYKNVYVRNSGYRYFDEESAVTNNGSWISGYESQDGNHTTDAGAKALYYRLISDVPEITNL